MASYVYLYYCNKSIGYWVANDNRPFNDDIMGNSELHWLATDLIFISEI